MLILTVYNLNCVSVIVTELISSQNFSNLLCNLDATSLEQNQKQHPWISINQMNKQKSHTKQ